MSNTWVQALQKWNEKNSKYTIPNKDSNEYLEVKKIQSKMMTGSGNRPSRPQTAPQTLEQIRDTETGLLPSKYLRNIILEYHFDNEKFIDKFIKEAIDGNELIPKKDLPLLKRMVKLMVEYASSNNSQGLSTLMNSQYYNLTSQSNRILHQLQNELEEYW